MVTFPHCKINLGLNVISKRSDGFHDIETCFYPVPWTDILEIITSDHIQLSTSGLPIPGQPHDNLCLKAYDLLKKDFDLPPVQIHLHKLLPTGAGLGGGSSDAAFALRTINEIFKLNLTFEKLVAYASSVGSDCAFFIQDNPMVGVGRGEVLKPITISLSGKFLVLVNPEIHVATAEAYRGVALKKAALSVRDVIEGKPIENWKEFLINDFEASVFKKFPAIGALKNKLYQAGAVYASMSGSGSSVYGIFDQPVNLKSKFEGMTFWSGLI